MLKMLNVSKMLIQNMNVFEVGLLQTNYSKLADFNTEISEVCLYSSLYQHKHKNLVKEKTCFKNVNFRFIDFFLTNVLSYQSKISHTFVSAS